MLLQPNQVKAKLRRSEIVIDSLVYVPSAKLTELMPMASFDFAVIDQEHGPITTEIAEIMVISHMEDIEGIYNLDQLRTYSDATNPPERFATRL